MDKEVQERFDALEASIAKQLAEGIASAFAKVSEVQAANHLSKVEKHAAELEKAADHMDAAGVGGHPTQGHAALSRRMAEDIRAKASRGEIPSRYDGFYAAAQADKGSVEAAIAAAVTVASESFKKQLDEVKAAAEKSEKDLKDALASAETKMADVKAQAGRTISAPDRKTTAAPEAGNLLSKFGIEAPGEGAKLSLAKLDQALSAAGITESTKRISIKNQFASAGLID